MPNIPPVDPTKIIGHHPLAPKQAPHPVDRRIIPAVNPGHIIGGGNSGPEQSPGHRDEDP